MKEIPASDSDAWNNAEGESDGMPILIRYRPKLEAFLGDPRYPRRLTITWDYGKWHSSGMPSPEDSDAMEVLEDALEAALDPERLAILAFIYTHGGARTWHYYVGDVGLVGERINGALAPNLPIELAVEDDPDWQELRLVFQGCSES